MVLELKMMSERVAFVSSFILSCWLPLMKTGTGVVSLQFQAYL
jgi:hypothetical protein